MTGDACRLSRIGRIGKELVVVATMHCWPHQQLLRLRGSRGVRTMWTGNMQPCKLLTVSGLDWSSVSPNCQLCVLSFRICFASAARLFTTSIRKFCSGSDSPEIAWPLTAGLSSTHTTTRSTRNVSLVSNRSDVRLHVRP